MTCDSFSLPNQWAVHITAKNHLAKQSQLTGYVLGDPDGTLDSTLKIRIILNNYFYSA